MRTSDAAPLALLLPLLGGCPPGTDDTGPEQSEGRCQLGQFDLEGEFLPLAGDSLELVLGFQGFLFVRAAMKVEGEAPATANTTWSLALEGEEPFGGNQPSFFEGPTSDEILLFLPDASVGVYEGRQAEIAVRMDSGSWTCLARGQGLLVDEDPCIHTGEEPICDTGMSR